MIKQGDVWVNKETGQRVLILRFKDYEVKYQQDGVIHTKGDFEFKDYFNPENVGNMLDEQERKLMDWVKGSEGDE